MNEVKVYDYEGTPITFSNGESVMVNATEMAKPFGKRCTEFLSNKNTKEFMEVLSSSVGIPTVELVQVQNGGINPGTWMHEDVAMEFARWLSPKFAIWCNDRIKELMKYGMTATPQTIDTILADPTNAIKMLTALQEEREAKAKALAEVEQKKKVIEEQMPSVTFANAVEGSKGSILVGELAKILIQNGVKNIVLSGEKKSMGQNNLIAWMREHNFFGTKGEYYNIPNQRYVTQGLFEIKKNTHSQNGVLYSTSTPKVTGKGQKYFINFFMTGKFPQLEIQF